MRSTWLYHVTRASRPLFGLCWRMRLSGEVDSIPKTGPAIVAANHSSFVDPWFLGPFLFPRRIRFLITRLWYDKSPVWNFVFRSYDTIPMERHAGATLEVARAALEAGNVVGIFPEGKISHDGRIQRFRSGVCYLAARTGAPVIPIGIEGAYESLPRDRKLPKRGNVTARVGLPLKFPNSPRDGKIPKEIVREFRDSLFAEICRLAGQENILAEMTERGSTRSRVSPTDGDVSRTCGSGTPCTEMHSKQ
jgi:1-acyl-sn-glycerol-3-phosphate acyltransferase